MAPAPTARVVWITRTEPGAEATARRVRALGLEAVVAPLLAVRTRPAAAIDLAGVCAIAFTSANAVRAFAGRSAARDIRVFAVGDATAKAARQAGFAAVLSARGDARALVGVLAARRDDLDGVILHPSVAEPSADVVGALADAGLKVRAVPLYETVEVEPSADLAGRLPEIDHVLLHSAKAARALAGFLTRNPAPHLVALALSHQAAQPVAGVGLAAVRVAPEPNEAALLALLATSA